MGDALHHADQIRVQREDHPKLSDASLVELSLHNVTYSPLTRSAGGPSEAVGGEFRRCRSWAEYVATCVPCMSSESKARKTILQGIRTMVSPYKISAWMGPSGSGKTSLITVAAGLNSSRDNLSEESRIRVNGDSGVPPKGLVGVVWQDDMLLPNLTVDESVRFAARLRAPESVSDNQVSERVTRTLLELGLEGLRHSLIGTANGSAADGGGTRGISGGERKRVAVAVELVARPPVLLLDEPTSGLDATSAQSLMAMLKGLARAGHSVAVVVHQPRTAIFEMFDDLLLLSKGHMVYSGDPAGVRLCLESCPGIWPLPLQTSIADWIMDSITQDECCSGGGNLAAHWREYEKEMCAEEGKRRQFADDCSDRQPDSKDKSCAPKMGRRLSTLVELNEKSRFQTTFWTQLKVLTLRTMKQQRGESITRVGFYVTLLYTFFTSIIWWNLPDESNRIYERKSLMFFLIIAQSNSVVLSSMTTFSQERALLSRERAKKMYGVLPYFLAKTAGDVTNSLVLPTLYGCVI